MDAWVYILRCADGTLYTGWTSSPQARLKAHNAGKHGAKYTRGRRPVVLVHLEKWPDKASAMRREAELKKWTRAQKLGLIEGIVPSALE